MGTSLGRVILRRMRTRSRPTCCLLSAGLFVLALITLAAVLPGAARPKRKGDEREVASGSGTETAIGASVSPTPPPYNNLHLPRLAIVDSHHHYADPRFVSNSFLNETRFTPEDYALAVGLLNVTKSVHIEIIPNDALEECRWVESLISSGRARDAAIVASCNLAARDANACLRRLTQSCPHVRGIRYILDYVGPYNASSATHVATTRDNVDYLRGPVASKDFEEGFGTKFARLCVAQPPGVPIVSPSVVTHTTFSFSISSIGLLEHFGLSFDLQCAPAQLAAAASLVSRYIRLPLHLMSFTHLMDLIGINFATRESVGVSHLITSVCFYLIDLIVRVRLSTLILFFRRGES